MKEFKLVINGRLTPGALSMDVMNPATGEVLVKCPRADAAQLEEAVAGAKAAFSSWSRLTISDRRARINAIADELESRTEEFARVLTLEQGKPLQDALGEIGGSVYLMRSLAEIDVPDRILKDDDEQKGKKDDTAEGNRPKRKPQRTERRQKSCWESDLWTTACRDIPYVGLPYESIPYMSNFD